MTEEYQEKEEKYQSVEGMSAQSVSEVSANQIISVSNLNVSFGSLHVLKNVSLEIESKKITVIMGPSGCGKSTFIRTINRMNDHVSDYKVSGKVLFDGVDVYSKEVDPALLRLRIGMVFQKTKPLSNVNL